MSRKNVLEVSFNPLNISEHSDDQSYINEIYRREIRGILESYHHRFDHLYESIQNAVDSCEAADNYYSNKTSEKGYTPEIRVIINLKDNKITVADNGLGMTKDVVLKYFFTPHATLKNVSEDTKTRQRGEKGVGATFLSYGSNKIKITTLSNESRELTSGQLTKAIDWVYDSENKKVPEVEPCKANKIIDEFDHGTIVELDVPQNFSMYELMEYGDEWNQWEIILKLYTALGYVSLDKKDSFFDRLKAHLILISSEGESIGKPLSLEYLYPHMMTEANIQINKLTRIKGGVLPASQQDMKIMWETYDKTQVSEYVNRRMSNLKYMRTSKKRKISEILNKYSPEAYVCFTSGSDFWDVYNNKIWGETFEGQLKPGIIFTTKSQRIGEHKRIDFKFRSGDFNRFFILINMENLKSDIGRKSLGEDIEEFANFFANSIQKQFTDNDDCLAPWTDVDEEEESVLEDLQEEAFDREDLPLDYLHFKKIPKEEQDVIALFFDLLGLEKIKGFKVYSTHASRKYDGIGMFHINKSDDIIYDKETCLLGVSEEKFKKDVIKSKKKCFIEFKYNSDYLVKDVRNGYKRLQDIKWLVCWEIGDRHIGEGISIIDITEPSRINSRDYHGVTHLMTEKENKVYVVELKKVVEILSNMKK
jgi:hypothetical protein